MNKIKHLLWLVGLLVLAAYFNDSDDHHEQTGAIKNYKQARSILWQKLYPTLEKKGIAKQALVTLYCKVPFKLGRHKGVNVEHVFPMSWATKALNCGTRKQCRARSQQFNRVEADLHNLFPALSNVNEARSSFRFGRIKGESRKFGKSCDFEVDYYRRIAEPAKDVSGEVARAMLYMAYQYQEFGLRIYPDQAELLIKWHQQDPPSMVELRRNDVIEQLQGNRNPFIDKPDLLVSLFKQGRF